MPGRWLLRCPCSSWRGARKEVGFRAAKTQLIYVKISFLCRVLDWRVFRTERAQNSRIHIWGPNKGPRFRNQVPTLTRPPTTKPQTPTPAYSPPCNARCDFRSSSTSEPLTWDSTWLYYKALGYWLCCSTELCRLLLKTARSTTQTPVVFCFKWVLVSFIRISRNPASMSMCFAYLRMGTEFHRSMVDL